MATEMPVLQSMENVFTFFCQQRNIRFLLSVSHDTCSSTDTTLEGEILSIQKVIQNISNQTLTSFEAGPDFFMASFPDMSTCVLL